MFQPGKSLGKILTCTNFIILFDVPRDRCPPFRSSHKKGRRSESQRRNAEIESIQRQLSASCPSPGQRRLVSPLACVDATAPRNSPLFSFPQSLTVNSWIDD